jgi:hypothetical protein
MPRFSVKAYVTVDVDMTIEADSKQEAKEIFKDQIAMSATLTDTDDGLFEINEDSISDITNIKAEEE